MVNPNPSTRKIIFRVTRKSNINSASTDKKYKLFVPPFLLNFEKFNTNLQHHLLVDLWASSNVMPYFLCKNLNATLTKSDTHIIQLDMTEVRVIHELKDVMIHIAFNMKFHQVIDIIVMDIP
jgi:hypothetical protein